jgi:DUF4097 and DUF4098 domain-containing protein YvlB
MRSETFKTPGPLLLNLELPVGRMEIETADTDETRVELDARSGGDSVRDLIDSARIELVKRGDGHEVVAAVRFRFGFFISFDRGEPDIVMRVTCPHGADLDIQTKSADIDARGTYGSADVKTASGDVVLQEARGDVRVKTASGDVRVETVGGKLDVNSASGDVHVDSVGGETSAQIVSGDVVIREAGDSVSANTVSGDQRFEVVSKGRMNLRAISGDISVGIRQGSRLFVDANTLSGSTSSELELADAPQQEGEGEGEAGPLVELFAKTVSGDVRIERA